MKNIQLVQEQGDYTTYSFIQDGKVHEVQVTGVAQRIINTLGKSLHKASFKDTKNI